MISPAPEPHLVREEDPVLVPDPEPDEALGVPGGAGQLHAVARGRGHGHGLAQELRHRGELQVRGGAGAWRNEGGREKYTCSIFLYVFQRWLIRRSDSLGRET